MIKLISGVLLGTALGWTLQKGGFCMNSAFRSILFEKDKSLLRAWILVLVINIPVVTLLSQVGFLTPQVVPFFWPALLAGGLLFGVGMVLAGGCVSGTYYRAGRGMVGSWVALVGFLLGGATLEGGLLSPLKEILRTSRPEWSGEAPTLFTLLGLKGVTGSWILIGLLLVPALWYLLKAPEQKFLIGWSWKTTGLLVGVLAVAGWVISAFWNRNFGLSFTQPSIALIRFFTQGETGGIGLPLYILIGVPFGAFWSAYLEGGLQWSAPDGASLVRQSGGGLLMGIGAALAGGCNIGHGITGLATLSLGSILGVVSIMAGCWIATAMIFHKNKLRALA